MPKDYRARASTEPLIMRWPKHRLPMRLILIVLILLVAVSGALFSALNGLRVPVDFYFFSTELPLGPALLLTLSFGWLLGGLVTWLGQVPRLRRQARSLERELRAVRGAQPYGDQT